MSDLFCFLDGFGSGGPLNKSILIVSVPAGSTVTATLGPQIKTAQEKNGEAWLKNLDVGEWTLKLTKDEQTATVKFNIPEFGVYRTSMAFQLYPDDFDWSGMGEKGVNYEIVRDDDTPIPVEDYRKYNNWKFLAFTSGFFIAKKDGHIDAFLVAGGGGGGESSNSYGGGGGGGNVETIKSIQITEGTRYEIVVGAGGTVNNNGGSTTAFGHAVVGGGKGDTANIDDGRGSAKYSNGASGGGLYPGGNGGSDGGDASNATEIAGKGQGKTTREFGDPGGKLYSAGGGGGVYTSGGKTPGKAGDDSAGDGGKDAPENRGGGGGGCNHSSGPVGKGGSGIVVIRNAREVA